MSEPAELRLYSPLQIDVIDRDVSDRAIPLQAVDGERKEEYLRRIVRAFGELQSQEDARHAFTAPQQDWSEISKKIVSVVRGVTLVNDRPYGLYICRSNRELAPEEVEDLKWYCRDQWEHGWGEGYAHCPREGVNLGLYIHFWQDDSAPLLTREQMQQAEHQRIAAAKGRSLPLVTEITPDTFWTLLAQAKTVCDGDQKAAAYWLTERLLEMGPEQALNFHSIMHGYMELADKYGLWNAAVLMMEDGCYSDDFEDFRAWLIFQGRETYMAALRNPDSLADLSDCADFRFAALLYVGDMAHKRLTGRAAYSDISPSDHQHMVAELQRDIVYGAGIERPRSWPEVFSYLPRLNEHYLTLKRLQLYTSQGYPWKPKVPGIQKTTEAASKKKKTQARKKRGDEAR